MAEFLRWPRWRRWLGSRAERAAARFLRRRGYRLLAFNEHTVAGELDLVALDGDMIVFIEVRSTQHDEPMRAAESVDAVKQRRLTGAALAYLQQHRLLDRSARFDVLAISWPPNEVPRIEHFVNAFEATDRFQLYS